MSDRHALVLGATGLIGSHVVRRLLEAPTWGQVTVLARRAANTSHPKLRWHVVDLDDRSTWTRFAKIDDVFDCLGTTIKQAGSQAQFRHVDLELPLAVSRAARDAGAAHASLISSLGADRRARVFYSRVKGEREAEMQALGFPSLHLLRPSLLLGERATARAGEKMGELILGIGRPLLVGPWRKYRAIRGEDVARAMVHLAASPNPGTRVLLSDEIAKVATEA
ncbi:MAG: NAD-dependent epimerase/dehydratase family protein [Deltaproteobacteria bacterium]|nr:NAD-dependent epimerase/dehydratase family protein [Deltaproteobacteria bacterium]